MPGFCTPCAHAHAATTRTRTCLDAVLPLHGSAAVFCQFTFGFYLWILPLRLVLPPPPACAHAHLGCLPHRFWLHTCRCNATPAPMDSGYTWILHTAAFWIACALFAVLPRLPFFTTARTFPVGYGSQVLRCYTPWILRSLAGCGSRHPAGLHTVLLHGSAVYAVLQFAARTTTLRTRTLPRLVHARLPAAFATCHGSACTTDSTAACTASTTALCRGSYLLPGSAIPLPRSAVLQVLLQHAYLIPRYTWVHLPASLLLITPHTHYRLPAACYLHYQFSSTAASTPRRAAQHYAHCLRGSRGFCGCALLDYAGLMVGSGSTSYCRACLPLP